MSVLTVSLFRVFFVLLTAACHNLRVALNAISLKFPLPIKGSLRRSWRDGSVTKLAHCFPRVSLFAFTTQVRWLNSTCNFTSRALNNALSASVGTPT